MQNLLPVFFKTADWICILWNKNHSRRWGFTIDVSRQSIRRAHFFVEDLFTDNPALPPNPGPFKVAAAFLVSGMHFFEFNFYPLNGGKVPSTNAEKKFWKSRLLFKGLSLFLLQLKLTATGRKLEKVWDVPSLHYRLELLNFIRWCEFPIDGPADPPPPHKPTVDMVRVNRLVMAMTLIIEACYYLAENDVKCDVRGRVHIQPDDIDPSIRPDLDFDQLD